MLVITSANILGKKYEIIGFVSANRIWSIFSKTEIDKVQLKLIEQGKSIGADAIISARIFSTPNGGTAMYGTVVKFIQ